MRSLAIDKSLEGIAGPPKGIIYNITDTCNITYSSNDIRIIYCLINVSNVSTDYDTYCSLEGATAERFRLTSMDSLRPNLSSRIDFPGGSTNINPCASTGYGLRVINTRVVGWLMFNPISNTVSGGYNSIGNTVNIAQIGSSFTNNCTMRIYNEQTKFYAAYSGSHDNIVRQRIMNYLLTRYNV